jgi:glc operon protein GlcG
MTKPFIRACLGVASITAACAFLAAGAAAQSADKFVVTGDAAKKAMSRGEINGETAEKIAQYCQDFATKHNIAVSIFILSPSGNIVHAHRMDGQTPIAIDTALYKAQTALYWRASTHSLANRFDMPAEVTREKLLMNSLFVSGGLPIIVDDQMIGAIGVGGSNMDEQCAYEALTSVVGPQPPLAPTQPPRGQAGAAPAPAPAGPGR